MAATNKVEISLFFISNFSLLFSFYVSLHCGDRNPAQIIYSSMLQNALRLGLLTVASPLHTALLHTHIWYGTDIRLAYSTDLERHPSNTIRWLFLAVSGSGIGTAESRLSVYGWIGWLFSSSEGAISIIFPRYITAILSEIC